MGVRVCSPVPCGAHRGFATAVLRLMGRAQGAAAFALLFLRGAQQAQCAMLCCRARAAHKDFPFALLLLRGASERRALLYCRAWWAVERRSRASAPLSQHGTRFSSARTPAGGTQGFCVCAAAWRASRRNTPYRAVVRGLNARTSPFALLLRRGAHLRRAACCLAARAIAARGSAAPRVGAFAAHSTRAFRTSHHCAVRSRRGTTHTIIAARTIGAAYARPRWRIRRAVCKTDADSAPFRPFLRSHPPKCARKIVKFSLIN